MVSACLFPLTPPCSFLHHEISDILVETGKLRRADKRHHREDKRGTAHRCGPPREGRGEKLKASVKPFFRREGRVGRRTSCSPFCREKTYLLNKNTIVVELSAAKEAAQSP